jgi:hypothetical protein
VAFTKMLRGVRGDVLSTRYLSYHRRGTYGNLLTKLLSNFNFSVLYPICILVNKI